MVHKNAPHQACRQRKEMSAVVKADFLRFDQLQVSLVDERRRLKALTGVLASHAPAGDALQMAVYERNQAIERGLVAMPPRPEQRGQVSGTVSDAAILDRPSRFCVRVALSR